MHLAAAPQPDRGVRGLGTGAGEQRIEQRGQGSRGVDGLHGVAQPRTSASVGDGDADGGRDGLIFRGGLVRRRVGGGRRRGGDLGGPAPHLVIDLATKPLGQRLERLGELFVEVHGTQELCGAPYIQVKRSKPNNFNGQNHLTPIAGGRTMAYRLGATSFDGG
jgi:hypothetical protein